MLYLFHGTDRKKGLAYYTSFIKQIREKKPAAPFFEYDAESITKSKLEEHIAGAGLFERESVVGLKETLKNSEIEALVFERAEDLARSPNVFILFEEKISKELTSVFEKYARKVWKTEEKKGNREGEKEFNPFALGDALGARERRRAWALFTKAVDFYEAPPESLHGILFAQIKNMLLAKTGQGKNLHPFVLKKAREFSKNYSEDELKILSGELVSLYHDARRGKQDLRTALERFILKL